MKIRTFIYNTIIQAKIRLVVRLYIILVKSTPYMCNHIDLYLILLVVDKLLFCNESKMVLKLELIASI